MQLGQACTAAAPLTRLDSARFISSFPSRSLDFFIRQPSHNHPSASRIIRFHLRRIELLIMAPVVERRRSMRAPARVSYDMTRRQQRRRQTKSLDGISNINQNELSREKQTAAIADQSLDGVSTDTSMSDSPSNLPGASDSKRSTRIRVKVSPRSSSSSPEELNANLLTTTPSTMPRASLPKARKSTMSVAPKHLRRRTASSASSASQQTRARRSVEEGLNRTPPSGLFVPQVCHLLSLRTNSI